METPTIYDVARAAGVATSTVSRAFNNPGRLREATRQRVLAVADDLGYRPNPHAKALLSGRTKTIAMVVSDITNPHYFELIRGAEMRARAAELTLILINAEESPRNEYTQVQRLIGSVDGFLLAASRMPDENLIDLARARPVVLLNRQSPGLASVGLEHAEGCAQIVQHLSSLGHAELVYLAGPQTSWMAAHRWTELRRRAADLGVTAHRLGPYMPTVANGAAAADAAVGTGATAVVAHNDLLAIGVLKRLIERGIGVPDEMSVVGFDDIFAAALCSPSLTTLGGVHADVGRGAVELLLESMRPARGETAVAPPQLIVPSQLLVRESSGPRAAAGR